MALLSAQKPALTGTALTYDAASVGGDNFNNTGKEWIIVKNGDSSSHDVMVASQALCDQGFTHNLTISVGAGAEESVGPFLVTRFNDNGGLVQITYSAVTSVTIALVSAT